MAYSELIKNFEKVRAYMREFYVYGFKSRSEYDIKSARSYDDERRRIESWLGDYMGFVMTPEGKNVFLSIDSRASSHNPLYKAWKSKSFTDGDITLHFLLMDILNDEEIKKSLQEIVVEVDDYLRVFENPMTFDESTIRKKLKEYQEVGLVKGEKEGRKVLYSRMPNIDISEAADILDFFSEVAPCGVVGSYMLDKIPSHKSIFSFKHHYITHALDSDVLALLFHAIGQKCYITADSFLRRLNTVQTMHLVPLKIYISAQNGRQYLIAHNEKSNRLNSYRLDYMFNIKLGEVYEKFDDLRAKFAKVEEHMWGVNCRWSTRRLEHVEFEVSVSKDENHIIGRLEREKRCGKITKVDENSYRFSADVYDSYEMIPWIRTFISRITKMNFSNRTVENEFKESIREMYELYGIDGGDEN